MPEKNNKGQRPSSGQYANNNQVVRRHNANNKNGVGASRQAMDMANRRQSEQNDAYRAQQTAQERKNAQKPSAPREMPSREVSPERQTLNDKTRQSMYMGNSREPSIQERARLHQQEKEQARARAYEETRYNSKNEKTQKVKLEKSTLANKQAVAKINNKARTADTMSTLFPKEKKQGTPDFLILEIAVALLVIGLVMVLSASSYRSLLESGSAFSYFIRQVASAVMGLIGMAIITYLSPNIIRRIAPVALVLVAVLVIVTIFKGEETLGATRWITIAGIRFTPSEMAKPLMVICTADLIKNSPYDVVKSRDNLLIFGLMLVVLVCIASEDLGSALAIFGGCFSMFIIAGLSKRAIVGVFGVGILGVVAACIQEPYRVYRIIGFLSQTDADASSGSTYQLVQSLYAFGSGGLFGVGLGNSGQKLLYLPGMHTDFIYSVIGEELGIIGALLVLGLFLAFAWRGFWIATRIDDAFKSYLAFGAAAIIIVQALINMGVAVGVLPVTGITLPFISYGGTSLLTTLSIVGLLLNMSRYAEKQKEKKPESVKTTLQSRFRK